MTKLGIAVGVAAVAGLLTADGTRFSYRRECPQIYDTATVSSSGSFEAAHAIEALKRFTASECDCHTLARMIVAATDRDLGRATNSEFFFPVPGPLLREARRASPNVAQVLCFGGRATGFLRHGRTVTQYQLRGVGDAREVTKRSVSMTLVGFRLRPGWTTGGGPPAPNRVWLYVKVGSLPDLETAGRIRADFERQIGVQVYLVMRTDGLFFGNDGPVYDVFAGLPPETSDEEYLARPFIACMPGSDAGPCQLRKPDRHREAPVW